MSNHPGAINEAFADVIGTATEFYFHAAGPGLLQGDYKNGEDVTGWGPTRRQDVPQAISEHGLPYPDHYTRTFSYVVVITAGTQAAPISLAVVPWVISDGKFFWAGLDGGGVHLNATVLGHAFYLAIEGGRNHTSARTVQGIGFANRVQIEQAFFRAMTMLMPNEPSMQVAASATVQAAVDLFGANSTAAQATLQAMQAVGLR